MLNQKGVKWTLVVPGDVWALKNKGIQHQEAGGMIIGVSIPESRGRVGMSDYGLFKPSVELNDLDCKINKRALSYQW